MQGTPFPYIFQAAPAGRQQLELHSEKVANETTELQVRNAAIKAVQAIGSCRC
jgi:hypothetical protein